MASQITTTIVFDAVNETPIDTAVAADMPIFGVESEVYFIADFPAQGSPAGFPIPVKKYSVVSARTLDADNAGATVWLDQSQNPATPADGTTLRAAAAIPGQQAFNHTTATPTGATAATVVSRPWHYDLVEVGNARNRLTAVHQCLLTNAAGIAVYISANLLTWYP